MISHNIYTAVGCNSRSGCLDWNSSGAIVYGACNSVVVVDDLQKPNIKTYVRHTANVTRVKWVRKDNEDQQCDIISGGEDCLCVIWNTFRPDSFKELSGHSGSITCVDALQHDELYHVASGSSDSTIKLWQKLDVEFECYQTIDTAPNIPCSIRLAMFAEARAALLFFSTTDSSIYVYYKNFDRNRTFHPLTNLLGPKNWVRDIDIMQLNKDDLLLASACQDNKIRIWKLSTLSAKNEKDVLNYKLDEKDGVGEYFETSMNSLDATLETVLPGHEDWIFGIRWHIDANQLNLLSCSADKTIIIWSVSQGLWYQKTQLGVVGEQSAGFLGAMFSTDGKLILSYTFDGSIQLWHTLNREWKSKVILRGHGDCVNGLSWDSGGRYLFTASADKTTLAHSCNENEDNLTWEVVACPQSHGYEVQCVVAISAQSIATAGTEKIVRVFQSATHAEENAGQNIALDSKLLEKSSLSQQPLKLSSKVCSSDNLHHPLATPEDYHMKSTFWPEIQKLYGHGHEVYAITCSVDGKVLASACKAFSVKHSEIILWNTSCWKIIRKFNVHKLTVTCLEFSHNCKLLLAVSKDRQMSIYKKPESGVIDFELQVVISTNFIHSRIIWCCCWTHDDLFFATSSRDGRVVFWETEQKARLNASKINTFEVRGESITSCAFSYDYLFGKDYLIAIGLETGIIRLYSFGNQIVELLELSQKEAHHLAVLKIGFRPSCKSIQLASCGKDHILRIIELICE